MLDIIKHVKEIAKEEAVCIDNVVFRLHSRVTVLFLTVCAMVVTLKTYFGNPIYCIVTGGEYNKIPQETINAFCWVFSTFTISEDKPGIPGIDNAGPGIRPLETENVIEQRYYKWVCFVLAVQALIFYAPRALWGVWERNIVNLLSKDLETPLPHEAWTEERRTRLINYFVNTNLHSHNFYAIRFLFCEILNLINSVCQIYLLDLFLDGQFSLYGPATTAFASTDNSKNIIDPMARLFPLTGKCTVRYYGPTGSIQNLDALCVMTLNIINEKIFILLWFWLIILVILGTLAIIYRIIVFTQPRARVYLLQAKTRILSRRKLLNVVTALHFGDWFLLHQLADNVNPLVFKELVDELAIAFSSKPRIGVNEFSLGSNFHP